MRLQNIEVIKMIDVNITGGKISREEVNYYIEAASVQYPNKHLRAIDLELDGDFVNVKYHFADVPFQRIRRITGYLVGTLDRFNNAKRSEEKNRVKHSMQQ